MIKIYICIDFMLTLFILELLWNLIINTRLNFVFILIKMIKNTICNENMILLLFVLPYYSF